MLCDVCHETITSMWRSRAIVIGKRQHDSVYPYHSIDNKSRHPHHDSHISLQQSSRIGCYVCHRFELRIRDFVALLEDGEGLWLKISQRSTVASWAPWIPPRTRDTIDFVLKWSLTDSSDVSVIEPNYVDLVTISCHPAISPGFVDGTVSNSMDISGCGNIVQRWITMCGENHEVCARGIGSEWYPTRLLDLEKVETTGLIHLIETRLHRPSGPYATLSYCWGGVNPIKLTTLTFDQFSAGILVDDLPCTFADAIKVAKFLGIRYLWIDALNILQDSSTDWAEEASLMGTVYQNAFINIGATASRDSNGGLFRQRNSTTLRPPLIHVGNDEYALVDASQWTSYIDKSSLLQRGWVTQERLLSRRMIHFTDEQVFWECCTSTSCEAIPEADLRTIMGAIGVSYKQDAAPPVQSSCSVYDGAPSTLTRNWAELIEAYSKTELTYRTDRLVAIAGLARMFHCQLKEDYIAGMWRKELIIQLAWVTVKFTEGSRRSEDKGTMPYVAPTWSWASVDCSVRYDYSTITMMLGTPGQIIAELLDCHLEYQSLDTFGQLKAGTVKIRAPLQEVTVKIGKLGPGGHDCDPNYAEVTILDGQSPPIANYNMLDDARSMKNDIQAPAGTLFCLLLYVKAEIYAFPLQAVALLLRREASDPMLFTRVGRILVDDVHVKDLTRIRRLPSLPDDLFDPDHGHTVEII